MTKRTLTEIRIIHVIHWSEKLLEHFGKLITFVNFTHKLRVRT